MGLIPDEEMACWEEHIDIIRLLQGDRFTNSTLTTLTSKVLRWKAEMVRLYGNVTEKMSTSGRRGDGAITSGTSDTSGAITDGEGEVKLSFSFPNFETCEHWAELIRFLGPPEFQDTKLWEQRHLAAKRMCARTNKRNITRDVLVKVRPHFANTKIFFSCVVWCACRADA
jgi:hypothetical protein